MDLENLSLRRVASFVSRPLFLVVLAGIVVRLVIMPILNFNYDTNYWAMTITNMQAGFGLYGLEGYYYTPVWGYILGLFSAIQEMFVGIGVFGTRITDVLPIESYVDGIHFFSATATSVGFNFWIKVPMTLCDLAIGYLIYWFVKNRGGDDRKAVIGMALWLLCPLSIIVTSVSGMFDAFSVFFTLLTLLLVYRGRFFLGGATFALAVLTKFFPGFLLFVLIAYVLSKHKKDGTGYRKLTYAIAGFVAMFLAIMLPQMMDGTFVEAFTFLSSRASTGGDAPFLVQLMSMTAVPYFLIVLIVSLALSIRLYRRKDEDIDGSFFMTCAVVVASVFLYPSSPQYILLFIPFIICAAILSDRRFIRCWVLLAIGGPLLVLSNNVSLIMTFAAETGWIPVESLLSAFASFQEPLFFGLSIAWILVITGMLLILLGLMVFFHVILAGGKKSYAPS